MFVLILQNYTIYMKSNRMNWNSSKDAQVIFVVLYLEKELNLSPEKSMQMPLRW